MQSAHFAKCMTHRLRWPSVQSHLPRSRSFTREQTVVSGPATGHRASRLKLDHQGRFQSQPKCVRFYTFNMCHLLYFSRIVKKNNKKKTFKRGRTRDLMIMNDVTLSGGISTRLAHSRLVLSVPYVPGSTQRLRVDDSARPRYSPSRRGGTPACLEGLGSTRRSGGHKTTGIRKWAFTAVRHSQPNPKDLGVPALRSEDAP